MLFFPTTTSLLPLDHSGFWSQFSHHRRAHPSSKSSRKGLEGSKRGSQALNLSARPMQMSFWHLGVRPLKTDSGKHFFGAVAVLGARSARKIVNRCHFNRFPRDFLLHVRPAQHHKGLHRRTAGQVSGGRAGRDGVDGRLTGTRGTVSLLVGIFGMREIVAT